jgi:hypothetical protein
LIREAAVAWKLAKGYRLTPWESPYLRWRIETWSGIPASSITRETFLQFVRQHRRELFRYLKWAADNSK